MMRHARQNNGRRRSDGEIAFLLLRLLAAARMLWAERSGLPVQQFEALLDAPAAQLARALRSLHDEGVVRVNDGVVELTERAVRELIGTRIGIAAAVPADAADADTGPAAVAAGGSFGPV